MRINGWFRALKAGILSHVLVSPLGIYEILMEINRGNQGMAKLRVGTSGKKETYSKHNIAKKTSGEKVGDMDAEKP